MSWVDPQTGRAELLLNAEGEEQTPSVVYFGEGEALVGTPAEQLLEDEQERWRVVISVKRELVNAPSLALPGRRVKPVEVAAAILAKLRRDAEELHFRQPVQRVVLTCPAAFDVLQREALTEAAKRAGFEEVVLLEEPVAAALAYMREGLGVGERVLVYDLGAGTFDLALLAREDGGFRLAAEPRGLARCGGDDFDRALYDYCDELAVQDLGRPIAPDGLIDLAFLRQCRLRKESLSAAARCTVSSYLQGDSGVVQFKHTLERAIFEEMIHGRVEQTVRQTISLAQEAQTRGQAVETVVLIGGSSKVPLVQRALLDALPLAPLRWAKAERAVALGAAYEAARYWATLTQNKTGGGSITTRGAVSGGQAIDPQLGRPVPQDQSRWVQTEQIDATSRLEQGEAHRIAALSSEGLLANPALLRILHVSKSSVTALVFSSDGRFLAANDGNVIKLCDPRTGALLRTLADPAPQHPAGALQRIACSPNGQLLAGGFMEKYVRARWVVLWDSVTGTRLTSHPLGYGDWSQTQAAFAFHPDGRFLTADNAGRASWQYQLSLWDSSARTRLWSWQVGGVWSVAFSQDGRLVGVNYRKTVSLLDVDTRQVRCEIKTPYECDTITITPDAALLVTVGKRLGRPAIDLWNLSDGKLSATLTGHREAVAAIACSPDGRLLASGGYDHSVRLWDLEHQRQLHAFDDAHFKKGLFGSGGTSYCVSFSPDGRQLGSGGSDGHVWLWGAAGPVPT